MASQKQIFDKLANEIAALRNNQFKDFASFITNFNNFTTTFNRFTTAYLQSQQTPGGGGAGGGGGSGGGGGGSGGGGGGDDKEKDPLISAFNKYSGKLTSTVNQIDELQRRAMASNLTLQKLNISELDARFSVLAGEILSLREEGFRNVNESTLKLISRMKMTDQSTQSLIKFLSKNSLELLLNTQQSQNLASTVADTARIYGVSQEKMFEFAGSLTKALGAATVVGGGQGAELTEAFTKLAGKLGGRADELLTQYAQFVTSTSEQSAQLALGSWKLNDQILRSNGETGAKLLEQSLRTSGQTLERFFKTLPKGQQGMMMAESMAQQFGGLQNVKTIMQLNKALDEQVTATSENNQGLATLKTFEERFANSMEKSAKALQEIVTKLPKEAVGTAGGLAGAAASIMGSIGTGMMLKNMLKTVVTRVAAGAVAGSVIPGLGTIIGIGGALWTLKDVMTSVAEYGKSTADSVKSVDQKTLDPRADKEDVPKTMDLLDILTNLTTSFGPESKSMEREALDVQRKSIDKLSEISDKLELYAKAQRPSGIPR